MESFLQGLVLGYGVSVPVGPINVMMMSYALVKFRYGFFVGAGAMSVDVLYLVLLNFGILHLLQGDLTMKILAVFGAAFLSFVAFSTLKSAGKLAASARGEAPPESALKCYVKGVVSNLLNPYAIAFWLSVSSLVVASNKPLFNLAGLFFAILSWIVFLPLVTSISRRFISAGVARLIAFGSAALIFAFAVWLVVKCFFL